MYRQIDTRRNSIHRCLHDPLLLLEEEPVREWTLVCISEEDDDDDDDNDDDARRAHSLLQNSWHDDRLIDQSVQQIQLQDHHTIIQRLDALIEVVDNNVQPVR